MSSEEPDSSESETDRPEVETADGRDEEPESVEPAAVEDIDSGATTDGVTDEEQTWGVLLHASAFCGLLVPFGNVLGPLLVWLIKRDESRFIDESGKNALNFQLTWTMLMLGALLSLLVGVGLLLVPAVGVAWLVIVVLATVRASEKEVYEYPLTLDLVD